MELTCPKYELESALSIASRATESKFGSSYANVMLETGEDNVLRVKGASPGYSAVVRVNAKVPDAGKVVVPAKPLADFVHRLPEYKVKLETTDGGQLSISSGTASGKLQTFDPDRFPAIVEPEGIKPVRLDAELLGDMVRKTVFAAGSPGGGRPIYSGVLLCFKPNSLTATALDGFRMAMRSEAVECGMDCKCVVPAKALREVAASIGRDGIVDIYPGSRYIYFATADAAYAVQLLEGEYLDCESLIPKTHECTVQVDRVLLISALQRAVVLGTKDGTSVAKMTINTDDNVLELRTTTAVSDTHEVLRIVGKGHNLTIAFNTRFLADALKAIDRDDVTVTLYLSTDRQPGIIRKTGQGAYTHLVLPVQTQTGERHGA